MKYPIQVVAKMTGITPATLRVWERRYRGVSPERDSAGRRLYSEALLNRLKRIAALVGEGYRVSDVVGLEDATLERLRAECATQPAGEARSPSLPVSDDPVGEAARAAAALDQARLNQILQEVLADQGKLAMVDGFVFPVISRVEELIRQGVAKPIHRSILESALQAFLYGQLPPLDETTRMPIVAVAVPQGQKGTLGAVASMLHAVAVGWYPLMLGAQVSAPEIAEAVRSTQCDALLISVVADRREGVLLDELETLSTELAGTPPILFGGRMPRQFVKALETLGLQHLENMGALRRELATMVA